MTDEERKVDWERQQVEYVFGLTGGELEIEPWVCWTQQESDVDGKPLFGPESQHKELWSGHAAESHESGFMKWHERYWYEGVPDYCELARDFGNTYRTLVFPGGIINAPHRELYDGQGVWKLVETYTNSGEAECPYRSYEEPQQRIVGGDGEADLLDENGRCQLCDEEQGDEHGYIYLGVCAYEAVYGLVNQHVPVYEVIVGNIGRVFLGTDKSEADRLYADYVHESQQPLGRPSGEDVTMFKDDEPVKEYYGGLHRDE